MGFAIWLFYLTAIVLNIYMLARIDVLRLDFTDGMLIGQAYYILIPMAFFLVEGSTTMEDLRATYRPYDDISTTWIVVGGMFLIPAMRAILPRMREEITDRSDPRTLSAMIVLFFVTTLISFQAMGLASGGHWQENLSKAFENNPSLVLVKYAANVARNGVFGLLLYAVSTQRLSRAAAIVIGLMIALADLFLTFNRITAVFLLISVILMYRRNTAIMLAIGIGSLVALPSVSILWPMFRGMATQQGYSYASMADAANMASAHSSNTTIDTTLNSVFESSNIVVLNWIVKNAGTGNFPYLYGAMYLRPTTVLVPGSLWPDRPKNFGLAVGSGMAHIDGLALNSTLYGEAYANFGKFWPIGLAVFLTICHFLFRVIMPGNRAVGFMAAFVAIAIWRFDSAFVGVALLLILALVWGLRLVRMAGRPRKSLRRQVNSPSRSGTVPVRDEIS